MKIIIIIVEFHGKIITIIIFFKNNYKIELETLKNSLENFNITNKEMINIINK